MDLMEPPTLNMCWDTHCSISLISYILLICDSYFDISYVLSPTKENGKALCTYYKAILTPSLSPFPWPGYFFPLFSIYKMCFECPNVYFVTLSVLWMIVSVRYRRILGDRENLQHWCVVVLIRLFMALLLGLNLAGMSAKCKFAQNIPRFLGLSFSFS